jgi:purine-binding chemotaxis protein CheW
MDLVTLIVGYRKTRYALDARSVQEIVWLPELAPIEEMPPYIRGVFNLRGDVVPVLDLGIRFGHDQEQLSLHDRIVVVTDGGYRIGILVHELHDVASVSRDGIEPVSNFQIPGGQTRYLHGAVMQDDTPLMLLDTRALLNEAVFMAPIDPPATVDATRGTIDDAGELLRARAKDLARKAEVVNDAGVATYAVMRLGGERFGIDIGVVIEFVHLRRLTPIPCAPLHVAGSVNLRGDILTVLDIRQILGVSAVNPADEIAVLRINATPFGVLVEAIDDVLTIRQDTVRPAPESSISAGSGVCTTTITDAQGVISLIDAVRLIDSALAVHRYPTTNVPGDPL